MKAVPQTVTRTTDVQCYGCGWKGMLGESKESIYLDHRPGRAIPAHLGGNGKRWRCPDCGNLIFEVAHYHKGSFATNGHEFKNDN